MRALILVFAALILCPAPVSARCAPSGLAYMLRTQAMHGDGAILVSVDISRSRARSRPTGFPELSLTRGRTRVALTREQLSPMLALYRPARTLAAGTYRVNGLEGASAREVSVVAGAASPPLPAPRVRAMVRQTEPARGRSWGSRTWMSALLEAAPPGALAVHVMAGGAGIAGSIVPAGSLEVPVHDWSRRCIQEPLGLTPPPALGTSVQVQFIDGEGRLSPPTTVAVTGARAEQP